MPGPFYPAVKGTTSGTPSTGAFTPNAASLGYRAWSTVPTGWIGLVRYEDGSAWELSYSYWNGTTLSRGTNQRLDSSSGSVLSLTSSATAAMVVDGSEVQPHFAGCTPRGFIAVAAASAITSLGVAAPNTFGTQAAATLATTNYLTGQPRLKFTSATTANAQAGFAMPPGSGGLAYVSTTAARGGFEFTARFGVSGLPTGPRLFCGMTAQTMVSVTTDPSAQKMNYAAFAKDSGDTNIQLLVNSNVGGGTKTDTGIPLVVGSWYEATIWAEPGSLTIYALLIRLDTGDIWFGSTSTEVPADGSMLVPQLIGWLSATTGTAIVVEIGQMLVRTVN